MALNSIAIDGKIVVGEGEQGSTELYSGEIVGMGSGPEVDVGSTRSRFVISASGGPNALRASH